MSRLVEVGRDAVVVLGRVGITTTLNHGQYYAPVWAAAIASASEIHVQAREEVLKEICEALTGSGGEAMELRRALESLDRLEGGFKQLKALAADSLVTFSALSRLRHSE